MPVKKKAPAKKSSPKAKAKRPSVRRVRGAPKKGRSSGSKSPY